MISQWKNIVDKNIAWLSQLGYSSLSYRNDDNIPIGNFSVDKNTCHTTIPINTFAVYCAMFLTGQHYLFPTFVALCDPALELHAHFWRAREAGLQMAMSVRNKQLCPVKNMAHITTGFIVRYFHCVMSQYILSWLKTCSNGYHPSVNKNTC